MYIPTRKDTIKSIMVNSGGDTFLKGPVYLIGYRTFRAKRLLARLEAMIWALWLLIPPPCCNAVQITHDWFCLG